MLDVIDSVLCMLSYRILVTAVGWEVFLTNSSFGNPLGLYGQCDDIMHVRCMCIAISLTTAERNFGQPSRENVCNAFMIVCEDRQAMAHVASSSISRVEFYVFFRQMKMRR
jgi:hypothetical protein